MRSRCQNSGCTKHDHSRDYWDDFDRVWYLCTCRKPVPGAYVDPRFGLVGGGCSQPCTGSCGCEACNLGYQDHLSADYE